MRITSKGQVTIPADIRTKTGLTPNTEVDCELDGRVVRIVTSMKNAMMGRGERIVARLRGAANSGLTTDEIMALTRGED